MRRLTEIRAQLVETTRQKNRAERKALTKISPLADLLDCLIDEVTVLQQELPSIRDEVERQVDSAAQPAAAAHTQMAEIELALLPPLVEPQLAAQERQKQSIQGQVNNAEQLAVQWQQRHKED